MAMAERLEPREIKNSVLLSIVFFAGFVFVALLGWWLSSTVRNDVFLSEPEETFEEVPDTTVGDDTAVIQVANGTNLVDRAGEVSRRLQQRDFVTLNPINADTTNQSTIFYSTEGAGRLAEAQNIGAELGITNIVPLGEGEQSEITAQFDPEADIQIIIGRDAS